MTLFRNLLLMFLFSISVFAAAGKTAFDSYTAPETAIFQQPETDTVVIRFDYKQSALFQLYTLETLDSVIRILLRDTAITLSIDGFAQKDEGSDTICYYISLNRALFVQTYVLGRGIDSTRIASLKAYGRTRPRYISKDRNGLFVNCRAELRLVYPPLPKKPEFLDKDEDGIADEADKCPEVFGYLDNEGCPDEEAIIVPFPIQGSDLTTASYNVLDSVVTVLKENPVFTIKIAGHANLAEGSYALCESLAVERAEISKNYLLSRQINPSRIFEVKSYGIRRPVNPAKNPLQVLKNARAEIRIIKK